MPTHLVLDVDGVLNQFSKVEDARARAADDPTTHFQGVELRVLRVGEQDFEHVFATGLVDALRDLHAEFPDLQWHWATTWAGHTDLIEDLYGIDWRFAGSATTRMDQSLAGRMDPKTRYVGDLLDRGDHVVWADDDLAGWLPRFETADRRAFEYAGYRLPEDRLRPVAPDYRVGLTVPEVDWIREFVARW